MHPVVIAALISAISSPTVLFFLKKYIDTKDFRFRNAAVGVSHQQHLGIAVLPVKNTGNGIKTVTDIQSTTAIGFDRQSQSTYS